MENTVSLRKLKKSIFKILNEFWRFEQGSNYLDKHCAGKIMKTTLFRYLSNSAICDVIPRHTDGKHQQHREPAGSAYSYISVTFNSSVTSGEA